MGMAAVQSSGGFFFWPLFFCCCHLGYCSVKSSLWVLGLSRESSGVCPCPTASLRRSAPPECALVFFPWVRQPRSSSPSLETSPFTLWWTGPEGGVRDPIPAWLSHILIPWASRERFKLLQKDSRSQTNWWPIRGSCLADSLWGRGEETWGWLGFCRLNPPDKFPAKRLLAVSWPGFFFSL